MTAATVEPQDKTPPGAPPATLDYHANGTLLLRAIEVPDLGHLWTGGPGGHPFCERGGPPLVSLCESFLRDVALIK